MLTSESRDTIAPPELYTIGYEGASQATLLHTLVYHDIQALLDIRELPQSRKPGLSKMAIGLAAANYGIQYEHIRALGTPRDVRYRRKIDHDAAAFRDGYLEHLEMQDEAMEAVVARALKARCCLMCYEADARECHRWFVAERAVSLVESRGGRLSIVHLEIMQEVTD
jgi:uncharacterized protein (DUF488 family)